jgi:hypothetical protein
VVRNFLLQSKGAKFDPIFNFFVSSIDEIKEKNRFGQLLQAKMHEEKRTFLGEKETKCNPNHVPPMSKFPKEKKSNFLGRRGIKLP